MPESSSNAGAEGITCSSPRGSVGKGGELGPRPSSKSKSGIEGAGSYMGNDMSGAEGGWYAGSVSSGLLGKMVGSQDDC